MAKMLILAGRGLFIVLEGIDGAGTSTQLHKAAEHLESLDKYQDVLKTHEPWKSQQIKERLLRDRDAYSDGPRMADLYVQDRIAHTEQLILPMLQRKIFVLSDRYSMSTLAYQWAQGVPLKDLIELHKDSRILVPDITFWIDVQQEVAAERLRNRGAPSEKFESDQGFVDKLIQTYRALVAMPEAKEILGYVARIDGNQRIETVTLEIQKLFRPIYESWRQGLTVP